MTLLQANKTEPSSSAKTAVGRLFVLELNAGVIHTMNTDGSDKKTIVTDCRNCDGIVVDADAGHIYWTNMGIPSLNDGSIERADVDGRIRKVIVPQGGTFTPKQIVLSIRIMPSSIGVTARACVSCARIWTAPKSKTWW